MARSLAAAVGLALLIAVPDATAQRDGGGWHPDRDATPPAPTDVWRSVAGPDGGLVFDLSVGRGDTLYAGTPGGAFGRAPGDSAWTRLGTWAHSEAPGIGRYPRVEAVFLTALPGGQLATRNGPSRVSDDGGRTWQRFGELDGRPLLGVSSYSADGRTLYAGYSGGLARSDDGGGTWDTVLEGDPFRVRLDAGGEGLFVGPDGVVIAVVETYTDDQGEHHVLARSADGGQTWEQRGLPGVPRGFAALPDGTLDMLGVRRGESPSRLLRWRSADGGGTWTEAPAPSAYDYRLALATDGRLYAYGEGLSRWEGEAWTTLWTPPRGRWPNTTAFAGRGDTLVLATGRGVVRSTDDGRTWVPYDQGLRGGAVSTLFLDPGGSDAALSLGGAPFASADGGATWEPARDPIAAPAGGPDVRSALGLLGHGRVGLFRRQAGGWAPVDTLGPYVRGLAVLSDTVLVACDGRTPVALDADGAAAPRPIALPAGAVQGCWAAPRGPVIIAAQAGSGPTETALYRLVDGGVESVRSPAFPTGQVRDVAFGAGGAVVAATSDGVFRSPDGGATWEAVPSRGLPGDDAPGGGRDDLVATVALGPDGELLAGTPRAGVFRWEGGAWTPFLSGLGTGQTTALHVTPTGHVVAVTPLGLYRTARSVAGL